jgi:REP element-mobilizing transposase RayT
MPNRYNPDLHHRRSIRLRDYDYSQEGAYFLTICTKDRECLFWNVGAYCDTPSLVTPLPLNDLGHIVEEEWLRTSDLRPQIGLDAYVVMPNHFHGIVEINQDGTMATERRDVQGVYQYAPTKDRIRSPSQTIGAVVRGFKSAATTRVNARRGTPGTPIWQRNYHEHVIRNDADLTRIRDYIVANPSHWAEDENNPINIRTTPS